jgi:hypothetical protein
MQGSILERETLGDKAFIIGEVEKTEKEQETIEFV